MTAVSQEALIDRSVIEELQEAMGADAFADIAASFCEQVGDLIARFAIAAEAGDMAAATRLAHELTGLAGTMGAPRLSGLGRQAMALCRSQQTDALPPLSATITLAGSETLEAFRAYV